MSCYCTWPLCNHLYLISVNWHRAELPLSCSRKASEVLKDATQGEEGAVPWELQKVHVCPRADPRLKSGGGAKWNEQEKGNGSWVIWGGWSIVPGLEQRPTRTFWNLLYKLGYISQKFEGVIDEMQHVRWVSAECYSFFHFQKFVHGFWVPVCVKVGEANWEFWECSKWMLLGKAFSQFCMVRWREIRYEVPFTSGLKCTLPMTCCLPVCPQ